MSASVAGFPARVKIAIAASTLVLLVSMGIRATTGLFMQPITDAHGWSRADFALAFALQNLVWGLANPFFGALADRLGSGRAIILAAMFYMCGLVLMRYADTLPAFYLANGVLMGLGLSGTTFSILLGVVAKRVPAERRSAAIGITAAGGSMGQFVMMPIGQALIGSLEWYGALLAFAGMAALIVPLAAGLTSRSAGVVHGPEQSIGDVVGELARHRSFHCLFWSYFTCGFHTAFITLHFPSYIVDAGFPIALGVQAIALIGLCNVIGTFSAGVLGGRYSKKNLLAYVYLARALIIAAFFFSPKSVVSVYLFGAMMGLFWLSTVPLTNGLVGQIYGIRYVSMISGFIFVGHQVGGFLGAWLGGWVYDRTHSYDIVWILSIVVGVTAALLAWPVDERPLRRERAVQARA